MQDTIRRSMPARWPLGLIGMFAIVLVSESFLAGQREKYSTDLAESWRYKGKTGVEQAIRADILCFGDSLIAFGVLPKILEDRLGLKTYNLALHAGHPLASELLLRRVVKAGASPEALVVDFAPHQLAKGIRDDQFRRPLAELLSTSEAIPLAWKARDAAWLGEILVSQMLTSFRTRQEVRKNLESALRGQGWSAKNQVRALTRNWEANQGAQVLPTNLEYRGEFAAEDPGLFPEVWTPDPLTVRFVHRFLGLAEAKGITVYWLLPPISPGAQARRDELGLESHYDRFVDDLCQQYSRVVVVDARRSGYEIRQFVDQVHLDRQGAAILSADLAEILQQPIPMVNTRWVALPPVRNRAIDAPQVEDLEQSRWVLRDLRGIGPTAGAESRRR